MGENAMKRNNKGITLVSLVITIIVMLILAGVSLSMVVGENSVLKQASRATITKVLTEIKEGYEVNSMGDFITSKVNRTENKAQKANAM
jgi:Tfp pilus assembly protein PilE